MTDTISVADAIALQNRGCCDNGNGNGGMGGWGDGAWMMMFLFFLLAWGNGGFGNGGWGNRGGANSPDMQGLATRADINSGFTLNNIERSLSGISQGICDSTYALNNSIQSGFAGVNSAICQGLNGTNTAIMQGFNQMLAQLASCCCDIKGGQKDIAYAIATQGCDTRNAIQQVRYDMATQNCDTRNLMQNLTRDILDSNNASTRAILDFMTQDKIASLTAENQTLKFAASQANQNAVLQAAMDANTAEIIRRTGNDCPIPAYVVPNPNCCFNNYGYGFGNGYNNGCGCGNGCGCNGNY